MSRTYDLSGKRVWVAGHRGMVGSALMRRLESEECNVMTVGRRDLDLTRQIEVETWMRTTRPQAIFLAAAVVGGIVANDTRPAEFLTDNLQIQNNIIATAHEIGVEKMLFLGSSCIYPRMAPQPMSEDALLTGPLEPTNQWYAIAKIAGLKQCEAYRRAYGRDFISCMPTNLYGPGDNYDLTQSHVLSALMQKAHAAKTKGEPKFTVWGTGTVRREFMHVDDMADACIFLMKSYSDARFVNVGVGTDVTIRELAELIADVVGFKGELVFDTTKPDGPPRKLLDVGRLSALGWKAKTSLRDGIEATYQWYLNNVVTPAE